MRSKALLLEVLEQLSLEQRRELSEKILDVIEEFLPAVMKEIRQRAEKAIAICEEQEKLRESFLLNKIKNSQLTN